MTDNAAKRNYSLMMRKPLPPSTDLGRSSKRGKRVVWHILDDWAGEPICQHAGTLDTFTIYMNVEGERICSPCHGKFSYAPMPHDVEWRDCGYETKCLIWLRGGDARGYGRRGVAGRWFYVHREAYEHAYGPIPDRWVVHHKCYEKRCVNPDHLEAMSMAEHLRLHRQWEASR